MDASASRVFPRERSARGNLLWVDWYAPMWLEIATDGEAVLAMTDFFIIAAGNAILRRKIPRAGQ